MIVYVQKSTSQKNKYSGGGGNALKAAFVQKSAAGEQGLVRLFACKKTCAALALGVSLWMTGGVALATDTTVTDADNTTASSTVYGNHVGADLEDRSGVPTDNTIAIQLTHNKVRHVYGAYVAGPTEVSGNTATIESGEVTGIVCGGFSYSGVAKENHVIMEGGEVGGPVYGGWTTNGIAGGEAADDGNTVTIKAGTVKGTIYGGMVFPNSDNASYNAYYNKVAIETGATVQGEIYGGRVVGDSGGKGDASYNEVKITGGQVDKDIYGGRTGTGNAGDATAKKGNTVTIEAGTTKGDIFGGKVSETGNASYNEVKITGGQITKTNEAGYGISGGSTDNGAANNNKVTIGKTGDTDTVVEVRNLSGGQGLGGNADNNEIKISGGTVNTDSGIFGGGSTNNATLNKVTISGGTVTATGNGIIGGYSQGDAKSNEVIISGTANVTGDVYGGWATDGDAGADGAVNKVTVSDTAIVTGNVFGGFVNSTGNASYNEVNITGGTVAGNVYGGNSESGDASGNTVTISKGTIGDDDTKEVVGGQAAGFSREASNNTVEVSGGIIKGYIRGGLGGIANNNTVTISENANIVDGTARIYGAMGYSEANNNTVNILVPVNVKHLAGGDGGAGTGNTLNLGSTGVVVGDEGVLAFQTIALTDAVEWTDGATVLSAAAFMNADGTPYTGTLDVSAANFTGTGTMKLLASETANNFTTLDLIYKKNGETQEYVGTDSVVVKESTEGGTETLTNQVVLTTGGTTHTVSLDTANSYKNVLYTIAGDGSVKKVDLSKWDGATYDLTADYKGTSVPVATGSFTAPASTRNILNAPTASFFGEVTGPRAYSSGAFTPVTDKGVTLSGTKTGGVKASTDGKTLTYYAETMDTQTVALGTMTWDDGLAAATGYGFAGVTSIDASKLNFTFADTDKASLHKGSAMTLVSDATGLTAGATVTGKPTQTVDYDVNGAALTGTLSGTVSTAAGAVNYQADSMTLDSVKLAGWDGTEGAVPTGWTANASGVGVTAEGFTEPKATTTILKGSSVLFADDHIEGALKYAETKTTEGANGVTLAVTQAKGVKADNGGKDLIYEAGTEKKVTALTLGGTVAFDKATEPYDGSGEAYNYEGATSTGSLDVTFADPLAATADDSMTLLKANDTLAAISVDVTNAYEKSVPGLTLTGEILGKVAKNDKNEVAYTVESNKASSLTFGEMEWSDGATLMDHGATLTNVSFDGAKVDTSAIKFTDLEELKDGDKTLIANYGGKPGEIVGESYSVGAGVRGKGKASMDGGDLVFNATAESAIPDDAVTHSVVMGAEVGMTTLTTGNDFIGSATDGLALASNIGADGVSAYAQLGGGKLRQETGSHVDVNTWNAIIALGHKNEKEKSTTQYGAFFEYGKGNYTTHNGGERGDGSMHYTGGGLLAKWKQESGFYIEGSLRAGNVRDDARNVLRDAVQGYSYDTSAGYFGAHLGLGKEIEVSGGNTVDVYAKYFHNRKNGVSFDAGGNHYDLDAVTSSVLRIGARYIMKREAWNFYGGLAYEHELDGKAAGKVDGLDIRAADIGGGSARLELGATMTPENSPWSLDLNLTGFAGKKRGLMGGVSVGFMF